ncbi:MAG: hypothetical protein Q7U98_18195 [Methylicorpusculum sp.]|uniref:hypothetical protein n=1 Tax=Methylicorpusculum sp. TaxID=2713644 RepID=UPI002715C4AB|nr:hypothetical protein [Methylicorpusculum sp.]MDO8941089.1 hypothetical protein [Methylicorpusculum sp.]MDP2202254.1 hypothetical protein [Methylicorpusculum sp.]
MILLHHAEGAPLKMSVGRVIASTMETLTYDVLAVGGSTGAPCLNDQLEVVAMHERAYREFGYLRRGGGSPVSAILADIRRKGVKL